MGRRVSAAIEWNADGEGRIVCPDCAAYAGTAHMVAACASVGIEHGKTTGQMLTEIVESYHRRGHKAEVRA